VPLPWDDFRLVKAVADRGGLTQAALHLGINHSTAFRRLAQIEASLDARLFERGRAGYRPTPAGAAMVAAAARMEEDVVGFGRAVAGTASSPSGEVRVTVPTSLVGLLMPLLARFRERHRAIRLDLVAAEEALNLSRRDADVAIRASNAPPQTLVGRRLAVLAWAVYGRSDRAYGALAECDWVGPSGSLGGGVFADFLRRRTDPERLVLQINTVMGLREAVEAGIGIGPLPCYEGDASQTLTRLGAPEPELACALWLLTHPDLRHAPRVRAFMDFVAAEVAPLRDRLGGRPDGTPT